MTSAILKSRQKSVPLQMLDLRYTHTDISAQEREKKSENQISPSLILGITALAMIFFGLCMLYSTSSGSYTNSSMDRGQTYFIKQSIWVLLGGTGATFIYFLGYKKLSKYSVIFLTLTSLGLAAALFFPEINGARRWIRLGGLSIQPSEFAKIALILFLAEYLPRRQRFINTIEGIMPAFVWIGAIVFLIVLGEDLGTTLLLMFAVILVFFVAGMRLRWLMIPVAFIPLLLLLIKAFDPMRWGRLTSFLDPEAVHKAKGYQLWNSLMALGSGGWHGLGFTKSRMKAMYLPEAHTDFILSIVGEELGFIAIVLVILGYVVIMLCGIWISSRCPEKSGMLLGLGLTALITSQAIINLGVVSGSFPTKGMPAPLISYGGSNMLSCLFCVGLLLSIDRENRKKKF